MKASLASISYYGCRFNTKLFNTLGVTEDEFLDAVRTSSSDDAVLEWVRDFVRPEPDKVERLNQWVLHNEPADDQERELFCAELEKVDPGNDSVETWTDLIDLEEGRLEKESSTAT